ncbi:MAG TPA: glucose-6-phosphate dehydrogenase assembly protein OpcA [Solirubrobacteraceae bacterium]|nr:glucose-6-phosphate dehydrogenase assembly protein OpcA [Solirubrobacteraceae bacterium]
MIEDTWSEHDTTPEAIDAALRRMLRERHATNATLAPARVLNLIVIVDREWKGEVANRLERVGRYHASRTVVCAVEPGRTTVDARATISQDDPKDGLSLVKESVELDIGPDHLIALTTLVDPVLVSELPTVCWSPHGHAEVVRALLPIIDVIMLDSDAEADPGAAFERAARVRQDAYVVDLAWLRTTPWRERLAASFHLGARRPQLERLSSVEIRHREGSTASALLLAGWLASRLGWERSPLTLGSSEIDMEGAQRRVGGEVALTLRRSAQEAPGLAGVTVAAERGSSLSLQRSLGGLDASETLPSGEQKSWKILGASRGEAGILGEGIRQALLREPTYGPALYAAREMYPESGGGSPGDPPRRVGIPRRPPA